MNNNIVRLGAGLAIVLGLAYVGNQVFNPTPGAAPAAASADVQAAGAPGARGFAVYPDRATEKELGLDYPTFNGNFVQDVTVTPLPPHFAGATLLRLLPGEAQSLEIKLNDAKCASPVHVALYRLNDRNALAKAALGPDALELSVPFGDGKVPAALLEIRMDEKAQNNYWCGVSVRWVQQQAPAAGEPAAAAPAPAAAK